MYLTHNDEYRAYTNTLIHTLFVHLFSPNTLGYSLRINVCVVPPHSANLEVPRMYSVHNDAGFTFECATYLRQILQCPQQTVHLH